MKLFILLCLFCLHTTTAVRVRIRVYKHFWNSKNYFNVSADLDITNAPATITVTKDDLDTEEKPVNFEGLCALLEEINALRPSSVPSSSYIYLRVVVGDEEMRVSDIEKISVDWDEKSVQIIWNSTVEFMAQKDNKSNYLMDIGDGGPLVGVYATESDDGARWPDEVEINGFQAKAFGTTVEAIRARLYKAQQVHLGGPCRLQFVEHKLLNWTVINQPKLPPNGNDALLLHLTGDSDERKKYWMKKLGSDTVLYEGELKQNANGKMEFHITGLANPMLEVQKIRNSVHDISTGKILLPYKSGLYLSVSEKKSTVKGAIDLPDRRIFGFTGVDAVKGTKSVVVSFDWLENADGSSHIHAIKLSWGSDTVFLKSTIYFDQQKFSGVAVVQDNKQCKDKRKEYLEIVHEGLQKKKEGGVCTVEASGPLLEEEVEFNGAYKTPLNLKVAKITDVGDYSFEIIFTEE